MEDKKQVEMGEEERQAKDRGKAMKQEITIPFIWEETPGAPKKDWKPKCEALSPAPALAVKYVASVPFKWEEKPGTPLPCFATESKQSPSPQVPETVPENKCLPLPPAFYAKCEYDSDDDSSYCDDDPDWISEAGSIQTDESFSTAPQLDNPYINSPEEIPDPAESSSSPAHYAAEGAASLRGATFLEYLFPMMPPKSDCRNNSPNSDEKEQPLVLPQNKRLGGDCKGGAFRRPLTLQELIMLSRRRSCHRKALLMKKQNPHKDFTNKKAHGCFSFGARGEGITRLSGKELTLKLA